MHHPNPAPNLSSDLRTAAYRSLAPVFIYFIVANAHRVTIHFLFFSATLSLIWVILLCVGIGVLAGMLLSQLYGRRRRSAQK